MRLVHVKLPDGSRVPATVEALLQRLAPGSPLLNALHDFVEDSDMCGGLDFQSAEATPSSCLDFLCEAPPILWRGPEGIEALRSLIHHLGHPQEDGVVLDSLERQLTVPLVVHMHVAAHWLVAVSVMQRLATWLSRVWLRAPQHLLSGLGLVDTIVVQTAVRAGLFRGACISESALCKAAEAEVVRAEATLARMRPLAELLVQEGVEPIGVVPGEGDFPIFLKFQGRSHVVGGCTALTTAHELKMWAADRFALPEQIQRLVFEGRSMPDGSSLGAMGVRRDSTMHLHVVPEVCRAKAPRSVVVHFADSGESHIVNVESDADTSDDILNRIDSIGARNAAGGRLCYAGRVLHPVVPLANYHLPEAAQLLAFRKRRRVC